MQITIKLKGFLKVAAFFAFILLSVSWLSYKAYKYLSYKKILHDTDVKQKSKQAFSYKFEIKDTLQKGYLLLSPNGLYKNHYYSEILIMNLSGEILMEKRMHGRVSDFRQWNINGHIRYTYYPRDSCSSQSNQNKDQIGSNGYFILLDSAFNKIKQVELLSSNDIISNGKNGIDGHDLILFSDDHYIVISTYEKQVTNIPVCLYPAQEVKVATTVIQEINNGKVTWQWDASRFPEFYLNSEDGNKFYDTTAVQDYMHINSMVIDPADSNLIVSFRNENQVIKINRHNGDIVWRLGGRNSDFPLNTEQIFLRQHNVTLADSNRTLLIFDNGEQQKRPFSRILEFRLDEKNKTISSFKAYNIPELFSPFRGSVQKIDNDYFICGGYTPYILQVNTATGVKKMKMTYNQSMYRAYWVKDITGIPLNQNEK